ncbi:hypothetical protein [Ruegeria sp.]|uniref:hypothetical protein n=1 Tax=Ruegeria sp. TaxID=1879320 RepID=UPI0023282F04|nr:hypothetical protein [Ruegeria sp.]MDA7966810.1 hypothetical protein [Ruegeria sp.]
MARTLKDLLLALLNATLILLALCLFLGWKLAQSVENIQTGFADTLQEVAPVRDQLQGMRGTLEGIRSDLSAIRQADRLDGATQARLAETMQRLTALEDKMASAQSRLAGLVENPEDLIDYAITTSTEVVADQIKTLRGCKPSA